MAQHFHGMVSRFAAGGATTAQLPTGNSAGRTAGAAALTARGLSAAGAQQLLAGAPLTLSADRQIIAVLIGAALDLTAAAPGQPVALLLPAVQKIREAAHRMQGANGPAFTAAQTATLQRLGLSGAGAQQLGAGLPVGDPRDRATLAALLGAAAG